MLSFEDIFLGTLDTYTKKMNPPSAVLGGGVHGKVCWLIAYMYNVYTYCTIDICIDKQLSHISDFCTIQNSLICVTTCFIIY